jgi:hypothetical protein
MEGSENGSIAEEEYTTALPAFSEKATKEKKERGFRGVLPFQRKGKRKDKDKDKEDKKDKKEDKENRKDKGKDKDRDRERERSTECGASALGREGYVDFGSVRGKGRDRDRGGGEERDNHRDDSEF